MQMRNEDILRVYIILQSIWKKRKKKNRVDKTFHTMVTPVMGTMVYFYIIGIGLSMILCDASQHARLQLVKNHEHDGITHEPVTQKPKCKENLVWDDCGSPCTKNCTNYADLICTNNCKPRCQCPGDKPIFHKGHCIASYRCPSYSDQEPGIGKPMNGQIPNLDARTKALTLTNGYSDQEPGIGKPMNGQIPNLDARTKALTLTNEGVTTIYVVLAGVAAAMLCAIVVMVVIQRRVSKKKEMEKEEKISL